MTEKNPHPQPETAAPPDPADMLAGGDPSEPERLAAASRQTGIPLKKQIVRDLTFSETFDIPIHYFKRMGMVPLHADDGVLHVAVNDPATFQAADDLARRAGCRSARLVLSPMAEIVSAINTLFGQSADEAQRVVEDLGDDEPDTRVFSELEEIEDLMDVTSEAPIIRLVNVILTQALRRRASDIHIEPYQREIKVRFRIDGVLYAVFSLPRRFHAHIVSRLKIMANLDIAEKRVPQDGRMRIKVASRTVDVRVSVIPMAFGERIVLRLLDKGVSLFGLEEMGLGPEQFRIFEKLIQKNSGIILVTGPTGSGKTTTLYAAINRINSSEKNIITIEDPIEYELADVGQIQVNPKTDLTFARGLRSILRHDPDVIMVGEIRDLETAEIAVQASLTGHLVFSTLHTNDAAGALARLVDMGVEPFLIASSLVAVVAQRLVRKICPRCRTTYRPDAATLERLGLSKDTHFYRGAGCPECMESGYRGRTGIFELLVVDDAVREMVKTGVDSVTIRKAAVEKGMIPLFKDGLAKAGAGITTLDEVLRVSQE